jgi:methionine--tRNA ligase beta chain
LGINYSFTNIVLVSTNLMISIDKFKEVELRVAKILSAERVENSEKLIKLIVDLGEPNPPNGRQIVAGIGKKYSPEELLGKEIVVVANLEPRTFTLRSDSGQVVLESQGMLLAADSGDGPVILTPADEVPPGTIVR